MSMLAIILLIPPPVIVKFTVVGALALVLTTMFLVPVLAKIILPPSIARLIAISKQAHRLVMLFYQNFHQSGCALISGLRVM